MDDDFKAGDRILIDGERLAVVFCTHSSAGKRVHGLDYRDVEGGGGWASPTICRKVSDEEWAALILMGGRWA